MPNREIGTPRYHDAQKERARLDRKRAALYRRQDAAIAAWRAENGFDSDGEPLRPGDPAVITALHQEQDHYRV